MRFIPVRFHRLVKNELFHFSHKYVIHTGLKRNTVNSTLRFKKHLFIYLPTIQSLRSCSALRCAISPEESLKE